jgi:uncharacterized membrane protein YGL010W
MSAPIESKVTASAGVALVVGFLVSWAGTSVFHGDVPDVVASLIQAAVTSAFAFAGGWLAKHTARPSDTPPTA